ncbi:MAG: MFS transporter [bacterium]|nr:MFS transporter [bacterium]
MLHADSFLPLMNIFRPLTRLSGRFSLPPPKSLRGVFHRLVWESSIASGFTVITAGGLLIGLAKYLDAANWQISLLNAMVFLVMPFQTILGGFFNRPPIRKEVVIITAAIGRVLWIAPMMLVLWKPQHAVWWLLIFVFAMNLAFTISQLCWLSWVGDLIAVDLRGRFFGARQRGASIVNIISLLSAGALLDWMRKSGREDMGHFLLGCAAILAGMVSLFLLTKIPRTIRTRTEKITEFTVDVHPWNDPPYRRVMIGFGCWYTAVGFAGPYWAVHMLTYLDFGYTALTAYGAFFTVMMALVSPRAGKWVDKHGDHDVATVGMIALSTVSMFWIFITKNVWFMIIPEVIVTAFGWAAVQLTSSTLPLRYSNELTRNKYVAHLAMVQGVGFTVGSIIGGSLMDVWASSRGMLFGMPIYPTHFAFAMTAVLRWTTAMYFSRLKSS